MLRAEVKPELLRWAVERSRMDPLELELRFPQFEAWERQERHPTLKQLEDFARATHTPIGFLFLAQPIEEPVPIQTLRPDLPGKLVEIVARAMHKDPKVRYANWFDMASDLANTFPQLERYSHEISSTEKFNKLRSLPFFREFRDAELWEVLRGAVWENHARDQNLLLEGEIGQAFFIIVGGQVKVVKDGKLLNVLKEGDCFGEMAYLSGDRARRSASIISVSEVQLLKIQASHLDSLSDGCQLRFNREFLRTLIERLTWTSSVLAQFRR